MDDYRVVHIQGQGYGYFMPEDWAEIPALLMSRVRVLATFGTEPEAQRAYGALPQKRVDKPGLHYYGGEWWYNAGKMTTCIGDEIELNMPVGRPIRTT